MVGQAMEWLNIRHMTAYSKFFGIIGAFDLSDYLDFLMRKTTSKNGVFAVNIHISNYLNMLNHKFNAFDMKFDYCYYLYRRKKIDQAYSLAKARITDKWSADSKPARELPPEIRYTKVLEALLSIGKWEEVYRAHIQPHISREYFYEDFSRLSKTSAFDEVLSDLGITDTCLVTSTSLKRQRLSSDTSEIEKINNYLMPADV
jgi:LPS sulfotransferase NodH